MLLHLPDAQQNFAVIGQKRRTDRITNGENVLYLDVRMMRVLMRVETWLLQKNNQRKRCKSEWRLSCHKRIIREKDAKEILITTKQKFHNY